MILAFECSSDRRSVALLREGAVIAEAARSTGRATPLAGLSTEVLDLAGVKPEDVRVLAVGLGPGSYTGIRAALAFAQGWELARGVPLLGVSSARACAHRAWRLGIRGRLAVVIDAQRSEAYVQVFELTDAGALPTAPLRLEPQAGLARPDSLDTRLAGPDLGTMGLAGDALWPDAAAVAELAAAGETGVEPGTLEPIYLRPVAFVKAPPPRRVV